MKSDEIIKLLRGMANPENVAGMARFAIAGKDVLGISVVELRKIAKEIGKNHVLAGELWASGIHEARLLAAFIEEPELITEAQMDLWALDFDSWDICDQVTTGPFDQTPYAYSKALEWSSHPEEFVKRAAFAMMAGLAVHDKKAENDKLLQFLPIISREAWDNRNFVKKAVNWALRNIGKRNAELKQSALECAYQIQEQNTPSARWIARDAIRELNARK